MEYVHIKNIEKYHPGYRDRKLQWCKVYFLMLNADPDIEMMPETDKWRFVAFIMLELQMQKPVPLNEVWLTRKGFNFKKRPISLTLDMLHNFIEVGTGQSKTCNVEKSREEKKEEKNKSIYPDFEKSVTSSWNFFCEKYPILGKVISISDKRRISLKKRFSNTHYRENFKKVLEEIPKYKFLLGENDRGWCVSFDWLICNDNNYLKVLEGRYKDTKGQKVEGNLQSERLFVQAKQALSKLAKPEMVAEWLIKLPKPYHLQLKKFLTFQFKDGEGAYHNGEDLYFKRTPISQT